jgi:hypothetical protein
LHIFFLAPLSFMMMNCNVLESFTALQTALLQQSTMHPPSVVGTILISNAWPETRDGLVGALR